MGAVALSSAELDFGQYTTLRALRGLAKSLAAVPGRKILIFLSAGFGITADTTPDLTAAIDACNKANVAVYPVDVRGLVAPTKMPTGALYPSQNPASSSTNRPAEARVFHLRRIGAGLSAAGSIFSGRWQTRRRWRSPSSHWRNRKAACNHNQTANRVPESDEPPANYSTIP